MMADSRAATALPPLAGTQLARFLAFAANALFGDFDEKGGGFHGQLATYTSV
jgi:hypothetical protein